MKHGTKYTNFFNRPYMKAQYRTQYKSWYKSWHTNKMSHDDEEEMDAVVDAVVDWIAQNSSLFVPVGSRKRKKKTDLWKTSWGIWLKDPDTQDPHTLAGKRFRLKFRVPYPLYEHIVDKCTEVNLFNVTYHHLVRVPIEFKVLIFY